MQLRGLAAHGRNADRVLEQAAGITVVSVGRRRQRPKQPAQVRVVDETRHRRPKARVHDLRREELQEAVQLVGVAAQGRRQRDRIRIRRRLERSHVDLQAVAKALYASQHAHGVAFGEPWLEQLDVVPDPRVDASARVDELERKVRRAPACS